MRRRLPLLLLTALLAVAATGCLGGGTSGGAQSLSSTQSHTPVTITFWSAYTGREKHIYDNAIKMFEKQYPWITVNHVGNIDDAHILAAITGGNPADAVLSFGPDNIGKFCSTGAYLSLNNYISQDNLDLGQFPKVALGYTSFHGTQCALPALTDAYGMYSNKSILGANGITSPPKNLNDLLTDAEKTTIKNSDGTIKQAGFIPLDGYHEFTINDLAFLEGGHWFDPSGKADLADQAAWTNALMWQRKLIDFYGYSNLQKWDATYENAEFTAQNPFEKGKVAFEYDGEWRVAFIKADKSTVPYVTSAAPTSDPSNYGMGHIGGDIVAIPRGSKHPQQAWDLIKFLSTNTQAGVYLSNNLDNLPVTTTELHSPAILPVKNFLNFFPIFEDPKSQFIPTITQVGNEYTNLIGTFDSKWESGSIPTSGLHDALVQLDTQIDQQIAQAGG